MVLGNLLYAVTRYEEAASYFQRVTEMSPQHTAAQYGYASCQAHLGYWRTAKDHYLKALKLNPSHFDAMLEYGYMCHKLEDYEESIPILENLTSIYPNSALAWNALGISYGGMKEYEKAVQMYNKA